MIEELPVLPFYFVQFLMFLGAYFHILFATLGGPACFFFPSAAYLKTEFCAPYTDVETEA